MKALSRSVTVDAKLFARRDSRLQPYAEYGLDTSLTAAAMYHF